MQRFQITAVRVPANLTRVLSLFGMQHTRGRSRHERKMQRSLVRRSDVDGDGHGVLATAEEDTTDRADILEIAAVGNRDVLG